MSEPSAPVAFSSFSAFLRGAMVEEVQGAVGWIVRGLEA